MFILRCEEKDRFRLLLKPSLPCKYGVRPKLGSLGNRIPGFEVEEITGFCNNKSPVSTRSVPMLGLVLKLFALPI